MFACFRNKEESGWDMRHGKTLLEDSISLFDGKVNPIRCFSAREIEIATINFDEKQHFYPGLRMLYRGNLRGQPVFVKWGCTWGQRPVRDIVVGSRLSFHKNVLKVTGCCLETKFPKVVHEPFDCEGTLYDELLADSTEHDPRPLLPWKHRLKIAVDLSNVIAYLHTALPRPLVHRDINPDNILLNKKDGAMKLFNFGLCMPLPEGESFIDAGVTGTCGYTDPEYMRTQMFNEKADIYGFGITLLNLLSGRPAILEESSESTKQVTVLDHARDCVENERFEEILDPRLCAAWPGKDRQFESFLMLALECARDRGFDRPDMTDVGTRLAGMYRAIFSDS